MREVYRGKRVLVTGGLGFLGSNLALRLEEAGARVTVVDAQTPGCGANPFNLNGHAIAVIPADIASGTLQEAVAASDIVFNLAGEVSHIHSMLYPARDLRLNSAAHLEFLNLCARVRPGLRIVYAGTRQVYGAPQSLPVDESHPVAPADFNGVHKHAAEQYHLLLTRLGRLDAVVLRFTNLYGPRMAIGLPCQGFLPVFTARAVTGAPLEVFGDGEQLRDPVYVADACEALLRAGAARRPKARLINIGSPEPHTLAAIAQTFARLAGLPEPRLCPFPADRKPIDIGSYATCTGLAMEVLDWMAKTPLEEGVRQTLAYFERHRVHYRPDAPACPLGHPTS
jgi:UDP-glucose 4-epimerase